MKISSLPKIIPAISTSNAALPVAGPVSPIDSPTVPRAEANSNIASPREHPAVMVNRKAPVQKIER